LGKKRFRTISPEEGVSPIPITGLLKRQPDRGGSMIEKRPKKERPKKTPGGISWKSQEKGLGRGKKKGERRTNQ